MAQRVFITYDKVRHDLDYIQVDKVPSNVNHGISNIGELFETPYNIVGAEECCTSQVLGRILNNRGGYVAAYSCVFPVD